MRLIDADNLNCETLPKKLYPHLQAILDFIDSQPTVEERKEEKFNPVDNMTYETLRSMALKVKHNTVSINTLIDTLDNLLRGAGNG